MNTDHRPPHDCRLAPPERNGVKLASVSHAVITNDIHDCVTFLDSVAESPTGYSQDQATSVKSDWLLIAKDGSERPIDDPSAAAIRTHEGQEASVVIAFQDAAERFREEHALHDALDCADNIIANLREPFVVLDKTLRVQKANAAFYRTFQVDPKIIMDRFLYALGNGQWDIPQLRASLQGVLLDTASVRDFEVEHDFPKLGKRIMVLNASRFAPRSQSSELILLAIEDVTARTQSDREVKASEARYRRLFETARDGIFILDANTLKIIDANPFMTELLKYSHAEFLGKELWEFGFFGDQAASKAVYHELQAQGYIRYDHLPLKTKSGESAEVEFISNIYTADNHAVAQCNIRDISERSRLERRLHEQTEALADLHRRKDEFLAMLSHELRNPLAPISNAVQLLHLKKDTDALQQRAHAIIERQVKQLTHLVDDLMEVSRITSGRVLLRQERTDMKVIVDHAIETTRPLIDERRHALQVALPTRSVWINADAARIEQMIVNLLNNAAKYTDAGGHICLTLEEEDNECVLKIKDSGAGIASELLPRIFDLFTQADRSLDRARGGLGIGLALVQRLAQMHGGSVEVSSVLGEGSEFVVRLPLIRDLTTVEDASRASSPLRDNSMKDTQHLRILIADDNVDEALSLEMLMNALGHEVATANDGPTTLAVATKFVPDVVLLDIGLPLINGYDVAKQLRQCAPLKSTVLIAITGYGQESDRQNSKSAGFEHHLVKPANIELLQQIIATVADRTANVANASLASTSAASAAFP